ncbi:MAG: gamma-glutamyl-gamma-aminobutyrate hydrolase family protein [Pyrinomonadaceae bacterium]
MKIAIPTNNEDTNIKLNKAYVDYVTDAGLIPVLIPQQTKNLNTYAEMCDGMLLPGGKDIDPMTYGEDNLSSYGCDPERDYFERTIFLHFLAFKKPVFGICRGLQLIAYEFIKANLCTIKDNLLLCQHIGEHDRNNSLRIARAWASHFILARRQILYGIEEKGWAKIAVNSMHHQYLHCNISEQRVRNQIVVIDGIIITGITRLGLDTKTAGCVVESFIIPGWNVAAVQWHPEEMKDYKLIQEFFRRGGDTWKNQDNGLLNSTLSDKKAWEA